MDRAWQILRWIVGIGSIATLVLWILWRWWKRSDDRPGLVWRWLITLAAILVLTFFVGPMVADFSYTAAFIGIPLAAVVGIIMATVWAPRFTDAFGRRVAALFDGGDVPPDPEPFLSVAEARRKAGRFAEAETEVRRQLESFPDHFRTQMLLAEIQAEDRHDLDGARATIERLVNQPDHPPKNITFALTRLADWHLKLAKDPAAARELFDRIVQRFPETPEAYYAHQRLAHLATAEFLTGASERPPIKLTHSEERLGLRPNSLECKPPANDPAAKAQTLVAQLERFPLDNQAREDLALVYALEFHRPDLAVEQLEQLVAQPNAPETQIVRWLNLLADVYLKETDDAPAARASLQRVIDRFPHGPSAEGARRRLATLALEVRAKQQSQVVRLGSAGGPSSREPAE